MNGPAYPILGAWEATIARACGLTIREAQVPMLSALMAERMRVRGIPDAASYCDLFEAEGESGQEWTEVIQRLVSHETSFFRHQPTFDAVRTVILPELRRRPDVGQHSLALMSAGCSTGQEAYGLAMTAMSDPAIGGRFTVWGADISPQAIETARRGRYGERAVATMPAEHRQRFLIPARDGTAGTWELSREIKDRVRFVCTNLTSSFFLSYDVIVCQNVVIYFSPAAVSRLMASLVARLAPGGFLVLGPGEAPTEVPDGVEVVNAGGVRMFRRGRARS